MLGFLRKRQKVEKFLRAFSRYYVEYGETLERRHKLTTYCLFLTKDLRPPPIDILCFLDSYINLHYYSDKNQ
jgi:hypothetical protein